MVVALGRVEKRSCEAWLEDEALRHEVVMDEVSRRKDDHLSLAIAGDVGFRRTTTLLECVRFVHDALPEMSFHEIDVGSWLFGKRLGAPLLIAAMTGGSARAEAINRKLAHIAEERGYAFGLGSQRAMLRDRAQLRTYQVRDVAPSVPLLANVGLVQARDASSAELMDLVSSVEADALCVHLNPAMELIQAEGDRDFRGGTETLERLSTELTVPVVAKETGCGLSREVGKRLRAAKIRHVDVSGAGGTSWVGVETERAESDRRLLGETFREWGIPTAASVVELAGLGFETLIATGGIQSGLDVAKCLALGASAAGIARPVLKALDEGGERGAGALLERVEAELRIAMLLSGARTVEALRRAPRLISGDLALWVSRHATAST